MAALMETKKKSYYGCYPVSCSLCHISVIVLVMGVRGIMQTIFNTDEL